jgi:hypothetical protein
MRELKFICAQPDDVYYTWQVHLWIESLRKIGHSDKAIVLLFIPSFREKNLKWQQVMDLYPEVEFVFYKDVNSEVTPLLSTYIPVLRPFCLRNYFKDNPEMEHKAVFYCDSDIVFTEKFNIDEFIEDDINYLSDTNSYINASYFDSKERDVLSNKLEAYKQKDVLDELANKIGISREIAEKNNNHSGGAQYLLKNVNSEYWNRVMISCIIIRTELQQINKEFFENENKGFQSWCADMWAVLWNLWRNEAETRNIPELEFSWSSDLIEKLERTSILHNAGITDSQMGGSYPAFYKGTYHTGKDPFEDPHLQVILNDERSKKHCTHHYLLQLLELKEKYKLKY